jgi:hypothetical protein
MDEWLQAKGAFPRNDWHPYIYTLLIEALQSIWFSPAAIAITQIMFMAAVCASFLVFLYKTGVRLPLLIGFAILVGIVPANGMMVTTVWKDIPYCCALLWLTLILTEIITKTYIFNFKFTITCFVVSLIIAGLFRHNGTAAVFFIAIAIIYWAIKNKNRAVIYSTGLALLVIISYKSIILPHWLKIIPAPAGMHLTAPLHGIAEVIYYNGKLTNETKQEMNSILPDSVWITRYDPYNIDLYLFHTNTPFVANISKKSTATVAKCYAKTFIDNPYLIARDRLNATELMWNITQPEKSFNYTFQTTLDESFNTGFKQHDNTLKSFFLKELDYSEKLADPILRRPGLFNILTLLLCLLFIKQRRSYGLIFLPVLASNLTLVILMTHQSFRYLYYVPLVFGFLWLLTLSNSILFNFSKNPSINNNHS